MTKKQKRLVCKECGMEIQTIEVVAEGTDGYLELGADGEYKARDYETGEQDYTLVCGHCLATMDWLDGKTQDKLIHIHIEGKPRTSYS